MYNFGSGVMTVTPVGVANPTPVNIGLLQEAKIDVSVALKELFGQYKDALAIGSGTRKWSGTAKVARISGRVLNALLTGGAFTSGYLMTAVGESHAIPTTPYQVTTTNSATWTIDQGVFYTATGLPLTRVASAPTTGQYSVAAGVYTFAAADTTLGVLISYNYTVSASGQGVAIPQTLIGAPVTFGINLSGVDPTTGNTMTVQFYNAVCEKLSFGTKLEDFVMPDFSFRMFANAAGSIGQFGLPDTQ